MGLPVPSVAQLSFFSGRPQITYTGFASSALLQATLMLTTVTELTPDDFSAMTPDDAQLCLNGILAMADYIYLRQPYQAVIAAPLMNETVGSYSYSKAEQEVARNAAALEVQGERTGVVFYDMAVQFLAKRTRAGGVYIGEIQVFEHHVTRRYDGCEVRRDECGNLVLLGPNNFDRIDFAAFWDVNAQAFPGDPGI